MNAANLRIAPHVAWQVVGGETVVVDLRSGHALGLNGTAGLIWSSVERSKPEEIALRIAEEYGLAPEAAREDVREFIGELLERQLLAVFE